jgi:hypothetical protein
MDQIFNKFKYSFKVFLKHGFDAPGFNTKCIEPSVAK